MIQPLFTYPVKNTSWYIVVAKDAVHFYFNSETGASVWQLSETTIEDLESRVNFDDLAVLFAKANGLRVGPKEEGKKKRRLSSTLERLKSRRIHDSLLNDGPERSQQSPDFSAQDTGFTGYSSSEDEESEENDIGFSEAEQAQSGQDDTCSESDDVNVGLDLAFESDAEDSRVESREAARDDFRHLLDDYRDEISIYDPWFLVEEELLPKFSQDPAFYGVPDSLERESIFDAWVASQSSAEKQHVHQKRGVYPTPKLLFFQFLQEHKVEVRRLFYPEFYKKHAAEINDLCASSPGLKPENLYRELRITLNDYADYEKAEKKRRTEGNLKVAHVENYLRPRLAGFNRTLGDVQAAGNNGASFFERWMQLCNQHALPEQVVCDATNFVVGDEKRLTAYLRVMGPN
ncbi:hypothetical protein METBIDRAFT_46861 [Metschnikowia bicuspidata var. bicuspidata NRRL YB-4993]|uniref:FF domain-containing protein n=1 Tax=Metschnikowia bicuspidata var. bicuspidata NRRL YB-4993 TaxID=869754 RepID=A0A1A0H5G1_9ASCO|nr:hypothetical protein METBIDRAFT_46861 [Metschnikowia bicuspidata var. bicuspidata NRRL YB-4993]OBA19180.1 hypothetical protein METBIDRAFT_46861 [Metschnikowia bicuspidata var. bicuspidata NRRL YB-4993]